MCEYALLQTYSTSSPIPLVPQQDIRGSPYCIRALLFLPLYSSHVVIRPTWPGETSLGWISRRFMQRSQQKACPHRSSHDKKVAHLRHHCCWHVYCATQRHIQRPHVVRVFISTFALDPHDCGDVVNLVGILRSSVL